MALELLQFSLSFLNEVVKVLGWKWLLLIVNIVNCDLKSPGIAVGFFQLGFGDECDVLQSVDLANSPEDLVLILAPSSDSEMSCESLIDLTSISNSLKHISLGQWSTGEVVKVILNFLFGVSTGNIVGIEESELANEGLVGKVQFVLLTTFSPVAQAEPWEDSSLELVGSIVGHAEGSELNWHSHPCLFKQAVSASGLLLEWVGLVGSKKTDR